MRATADAVPNSSYIAKSRASLEALKSANLLKSLNLNVLITGEAGVGKKSLAKYIYKDGYIVDGSNYEELTNAIGSNKKLIIKNFSEIKNFAKIKDILNSSKNKIIATSCRDIDSKIEDEFFSLKINIPPLSDRLEDARALSKKFFNEAKEIFGDQSKEFDFDKLELDLSKNCYSLRKSIYKSYFKSEVTKSDIMAMMKNFLFHKIGGGDDYRELLYLFDIPLIESGFEKFGSQLAMSKAFGLNRNTLRKKINSYNIKSEEGKE